MASILSFVRKLDVAFDTDTTKAMELAFDVACMELHDGANRKLSMK